MRSPDVQRDFCEFLASLNAAGVKYLVVGAYAVAVHGAPRNTLDLDVFVQPTVSNGKRLVRALDAFGFGGLGLTANDFAGPDRILQLGRQPLRIDILTSISGVTWTAAWTRRVPGHYGDVPTPFIGHEALVANKRASGRAKDLGDVEALTRVRRTRHSPVRRKKKR